MKKFLILVIFFFGLFSIINVYWADCKYIKWSDTAGNLASCLSDWKVLDPWSVEVLWNWEQWFKYQINEWISKLAVALSLLAIAWIAYGSFMFVISAWEEEKVKKWKDIVKWSIIGMIGVVLASWIIAIIVNLMYLL